MGERGTYLRGTNSGQAGRTTTRLTVPWPGSNCACKKNSARWEGYQSIMGGGVLWPARDEEKRTEGSLPSIYSRRDDGTQKLPASNRKPSDYSYLFHIWGMYKFLVRCLNSRPTWPAFDGGTQCCRHRMYYLPKPYVSLMHAQLTAGCARETQFQKWSSYLFKISHQKLRVRSLACLPSFWVVIVIRNIYERS